MKHSHRAFSMVALSTNARCLLSIPIPCCMSGKYSNAYTHAFSVITSCSLLSLSWTYHLYPHSASARVKETNSNLTELPIIIPKSLGKQWFYWPDFALKGGQHHWDMSTGKTQKVTILNNNNKKNFLSAISSWKRVLKRFTMTINALKKTREMTIMNYSQWEYVQHVGYTVPPFWLNK